MAKKIAVVHGRFQPLHNGHLEDYIMKAVEKSKCDYLYIGITNADKSHVKSSKSDLQRSKPQNNPLNYVERLEMIKSALIERGLKRESFEIIPFPINRTDLMPSYHIQNATFYLTIFDQWGMDKQAELIQMYGEENVEVLLKGSTKDKKVTATMVRKNMKSGKNWENMVPKAVSKFLKENKLIDRIIKLQE